MKASQDIDVQEINLIAQDMMALAHLLIQMEVDANGLHSFTARSLMRLASSLFASLEGEDHSS